MPRGPFLPDGASATRVSAGSNSSQSSGKPRGPFAADGAERRRRGSSAGSTVSAASTRSSSSTCASSSVKSARYVAQSTTHRSYAPHEMSWARQEPEWDAHDISPESPWEIKPWHKQAACESFRVPQQLSGVTTHSEYRKYTPQERVRAMQPPARDDDDVSPETPWGLKPWHKGFNPTVSEPVSKFDGKTTGTDYRHFTSAERSNAKPPPERDAEDMSPDGPWQLKPWQRGYEPAAKKSSSRKQKSHRSGQPRPESASRDYHGNSHENSRMRRSLSMPPEMSSPSREPAQSARGSARGCDLSSHPAGKPSHKPLRM